MPTPNESPPIWEDPRREAAMPPPLHAEGASLEALFDSAPEGIVIVDGNDRVIRINAEFTRMFGYTQEEAVGRPINDLVAPPDLLDEALILTGAVNRGERARLESVRRTRTGELIDVSIIASPVRTGDGSMGAYAIYRNIGDRKEQERALRESEARYRALFDQSPVGVFLCDSKLRITHCNERLTRIIGVRYDEIVGMRLERIVRDSRILPGLREALSGKAAFYEGPYRLAPGQVIWISVRYAPLRDDGSRVIGGVGVLEDITERQKADQQLRAQAAELERVNAALRERTLEVEAAMQSRNRMYAVMNHELRTPISAIMLYQDLLLTGALGELGEEQTQALEHSHTAAGQLLELVQDILDLSKFEAGKIRLSPSRIVLDEFVNELVATVQPLGRSYGSSIAVEIAETPAAVVTDAQRVRQILLNFVSNAAKFGRGRPITLRYRETAAREPVLEVQDRGIGIGDADLERVFQDFVQLGEAEQVGGTGLGLAISRRLAQLLGGRIEVRSREGEGSTFSLVLPAECRAAEDSPGRKEPPSEAGPARKTRAPP